MIRICNHCRRRVLANEDDQCPSCYATIDLGASERLEAAQEARLAFEKAQLICNFCQECVVPSEDGSCPSCQSGIDREASALLTARAKAVAAIDAEERQALLLQGRHESKAMRYLVRAGIVSGILGATLLLLSIFVFPEESKAHQASQGFGFLLLMPLALSVHVLIWQGIFNPWK